MSLIFLNGDYIKDNAPLISHRDSGFTTGIGIFDSMLAQNGEPIYIQEHYERIVHNTKIVIGFKPELSFNKFKKICYHLLKKNNLKDNYARIRTTITGGIVKVPLAPAQEPTILIDTQASTNPDNIKPAKCVIIKDFPRIAGCTLENCKRLDYSRSYAARRAAEKRGGDEAILTNTSGNIACGTTSNIFIEENGQLITPPLSDGVLAGITRKNLIEKRNVKEESISIDRLKNADNIFLTNSFIGLRQAFLI